MIKLHIEKICEHVFLIRGGLNFEYGKPYDFIVSLINRDGEYFLEGLKGEFSIEAAREIKKALIALGLKKVNLERIKNNIKKARGYAG